MAERVVVWRFDVETQGTVKSIKDLIAQNKLLRKEIESTDDRTTESAKRQIAQYQANRQELVNFRRELNQTASFSQRISEGFVSAFKRIGGAIAVAFTFDGIKNFVQDVAQFTGEIDKGFARVNTVAQLTGEEFDNLRDRAIEAGTKGASALEEIPNTLFDIVSATSDVELSQEILEASIRASDAGFSDLNATAAAGTGILNAVGKEVTNIDEIFDVLFATQKAGVLTFDDLAKQLPLIIPSAKALGVGFEETSAALATITKQGVPIDQAATSLKAFFSEFQQEDKLEAFNEILARTGGSVFDSTGALRPLVEIIQDLRNVAGSSENDLEKLQVFQELGLGRQSFVGLQSLVSGFEDLAEITPNIATASDGIGELEIQLAASANGARDLGIATNEYKAALLDLGERITPTLREAQIKLLNTGKVLIENFLSIADTLRNSQLFMDALKGAAIALSVILGQRLLKSFQALNIVIKASPIGRFVALATALGFAFRKLFEENEGFRNAIVAFGEQFQQTFGDLFELIGQLSGGFRSFVAENEGVANLIESVFGFIGSVLTGAVERATNALKFLGFAFQVISDNANLAFVKIKEEINQFLLNAELASERVKGFFGLGENTSNDIARIESELAASESRIEAARIARDERVANRRKKAAEESLKEVEKSVSQAGEKVNKDIQKRTVAAAKKSTGELKKIYDNAIKDINQTSKKEIERSDLNLQKALFGLDEEDDFKLINELQRNAIREQFNSRIEANEKLLEAARKFQGEDSEEFQEYLEEKERLSFGFSKALEDNTQQLAAGSAAAEERVREQAITRLENDLDTLQNRIDLAKLEIEGQSDELSEAGVDVEKLTRDRISQITRDFGLEQLEIEKENREALAEIEFKRGVESVKRTKEFEEQKLVIALDIAQRRLAILEATEGTQTAELNEARAAIAGIQSDLNKLGATPNVLSKILGFDEGDSFEDRLRKSIDSISGYAGQGLDIINSLAQSSFESALGSIDRQIEAAMSSIDRLTQEQSSLDGEIENASASQIAALEERRRANEIALAEEQQSLMDLEAEKERIRMEEFEREKKLAREKILLESAVQLFKALASLNFIQAAIVGASTIAQIAAVNARQFELGGLIDANGGTFPIGGGLIKGKRHSQGGVPFLMKGKNGYGLGEAEDGEIMFSRKAVDYYGKENLLAANDFANSASSFYRGTAVNNRLFEDNGLIGNLSQQREFIDMSETNNLLRQLVSKDSNLVLSISEFNRKSKQNERKSVIVNQ